MRCHALVITLPKIPKMVCSVSCPAILENMGQYFCIKAQPHFDKQSLVQKAPSLFLCDVDLRVANANLLYLQPYLPEFFFMNKTQKGLFRFLQLDGKHSLLVEENQKTVKGKMKFLYLSSSLAVQNNMRFVKCS